MQIHQWDCYDTCKHSQWITFMAVGIQNDFKWQMPASLYLSSLDLLSSTNTHMAVKYLWLSIKIYSPQFKAKYTQKHEILIDWHRHKVNDTIDFTDNWNSIKACNFSILYQSHDFHYFITCSTFYLAKRQIADQMKCIEFSTIT